MKPTQFGSQHPPADGQNIPVLMASGICWHFGRWAAAFAVPFLAYESFDSALFAQLAGAISFVPMLFGIVFIGPWSDKLGPVHATRLGLTIFVVACLALGCWWTLGLSPLALFPTAAGFGLSNTLDLTGRKALLARQTGVETGSLLARESFFTAVCQMAGPAFAGYLLSVLPVAVLFTSLSAAGAAALLLLHLSAADRTSGTPMGRGAVANRTQPNGKGDLRAVIVVTLIMNIGYFSHMPLIPALSDRFSDSPGLAGLLAAAAGVGTTLGAASLMTWFRTVGSLQVFYVGSGLALAGLFAAAGLSDPVLAFVSFGVAGYGLSGFITMQSVLVAEASPPEQLGAAMGKMSTAIGILPFSMLMVGAMAEAWSASFALALVSASGCIALGAMGIADHRRGRTKLYDARPG